MTSWQYYPRASQCPPHLVDVIDVFKKHAVRISSGRKRKHHSNAVLSVLASDLKQLDYRVETGKRRKDKVNVPVLFGRNGEVQKSFDADAYNRNESTAGPSSRSAGSSSALTHSAPQPGQSVIPSP